MSATSEIPARIDRTSSSLRPLALTQSLLSRADGSSKFAFGPLSVMASITGPTEVRIRDELVDRAFLEIHIRPLRALPGPSSKNLESVLRSLLTPLLLLQTYPRSLIQLTLQTLSSPTTMYKSTILPTTGSSTSTSPLESRSAELATLINASTCALIDAGIASKGMLFAVALSIMKDGEFRLDPNAEEEESARSNHVFGFSFGLGVGGTEGECTGIESNGHFDENELFEAQDLAQKACQGILAFVRKSIEVKYGAESEAVVKKGIQVENEIKDDSEMEED